jgi:hypothetical protein
MELYKKGKLDATLIHTYYSPEYIRDVKESRAHIAEGMDNFTRDEKRETFDLLDLHGRFAIEDGEKVVYVECILDARCLTLKSSKCNSGIANRRS